MKKTWYSKGKGLVRYIPTIIGLPLWDKRSAMIHPVKPYMTIHMHLVRAV